MVVGPGEAAPDAGLPRRPPNSAITPRIRRPPVAQQNTNFEVTFISQRR